MGTLETEPTAENLFCFLQHYVVDASRDEKWNYRPAPRPVELDKGHRYGQHSSLRQGRL